MAKDQLAARHEGSADLPFRSPTRPRRGRPQAPHARQSHAVHAGRRGLACRRASVDGRAKILCVKPARRHEPQEACRRDQGQMGLRARASATKGRTRPRPLRRQILDGVTPTRIDDHDRLRLPTSPAASKRRDGKKRIGGPPPQPTLPAIRQAILDILARPPSMRCPTAQNSSQPTTNKICQSSASKLHRSSLFPRCIIRIRSHIHGTGRNAGLAASEVRSCVTPQAAALREFHLDAFIFLRHDTAGPGEVI